MLLDESFLHRAVASQVAALPAFGLLDPEKKADLV